MIGQVIAHYRIVEKLGSGGMGVVYEAEDLKLHRHVALKFLPSGVAADSPLLRRFEREAQAASALNHPNICTIYEVEEHNSQPVIVMELLEGESLKERIRKGHISTEELLDLGIQASDALGAAHAKGIVHRDIKPGNIYIVPEGRVKILDFGLAKLIPSHLQGGEVEEESLTMEGVIPGTTAYMSPEQVRGEEADARSDLFSLGVVLYEMATRKRPFVGKNRVLLMDAILNASPVAPSQLNRALPGTFDTIIAKSLEKDPASRYQHAADLGADLKRLKRETESRPSAVAAVIPTVQTKRRTAGWKLVLSACAIVILISAGTFFYSHRATALTERDTIVLADFDNRTRDPVFDDTLKQALAVDLGQSPFLNIISDRKMTAMLFMMGRAPDQPVTGEVARELCQRVQSKAMLAGSISVLGNIYVIALNAINCATGDTLVREQVEAHGKEDVLKALGDAASDMRRKLGESLASIQRFTTPIEEATTSSLEALKAYSMGRRAGYAKGDVAAIPYYQRALELDPNFALAYRGLEVAYVNLGQPTRALDNVKRAFDLRERVSEREKYAITARYYSDFTGELEKANQAYELLAQSYPRDFLATLNLADNYMRLGQWQKAFANDQESLRQEPNSAGSNSNLAWIQLALNRPDDARTTLEQALSRHMDSVFLRLALYQTAFVEGDDKKMNDQLAWAAGRAGEEDWLLSAQSDTEAYFGHLGKARELSQKAVASGLHADAKETAALWQANVALREAEVGNVSLARQYALAALALAEGKSVQSVAALTLARVGDTPRAEKLAEKLNNDFPQDTIMQGYWLPSIRAAMELYGNNESRVIGILEASEPYELCQSQPFQLGMMFPVYLRGQAYLLLHKGKEASDEFQKIIDHRGIVLNFPLGALAHLGLARAFALQGDVAKAQPAYKDFLTLWKDADPDIPILKEAQAEYAKLR